MTNNDIEIISTGDEKNGCDIFINNGVLTIQSYTYCSATGITDYTNSLFGKSDALKLIKSLNENIGNIK